jgi:hypothetical protein
VFDQVWGYFHNFPRAPPANARTLEIIIDTVV